MKKFVKLCLHSSKVVQIFLQFDEIFRIKFKLPIFGFCDTKTTSSGNFR